MSELATAYVQLVPTATGMKDKIAKELGGEASAAGKSAGDAAGNSMGASLGSAFKKVVVALGLGKIVKDALDAGGALQQSFGGLETIYGEAAAGAKAYAAEAVKAGISANSYAEQAVSFGASLKQAFGGDTTKAMEAANTAILDMADNSAKMGTDITAVQNAYQGFAKQNYTMLDNLKLGYGGTKTEMERLLADAEKLSGVKYDINNLGDVYSAIHVIQGELGLTGVAAAEAEGTFTGSMASMKAAAQNLLANIALGEDITPSFNVLIQSLEAFIKNNLLPMLGNIAKASPDLANSILGALTSAINTINLEADIPGLLDAGMGIVKGILNGIIEWSPYLLDHLLELLKNIGSALVSFDWGSLASELYNTFADTWDEYLGTDAAGIIPAIIQGITNTISDLLAQANVIIKEFGDAITQALPGVLSAGVSILTEIVNGILSSLPQLITSAGEVINTLSDALLSQLPIILDAGVQLLLNITQGILDNLPEIAASATKVIMELQLTIVKHYPEILQKGFELLGKLAAGLIKATPQVLEAMLSVLNEAAAEVGKVDWIDLGLDIVKGIGRGIASGAGAIKDAITDVCSNAWNSAKSFWKIGSPSKLMEDTIGKMIPQGMAIGIKEDAGYVTNAMEEVATESVEASKAVPYYGDVQTNGGSGSVSIVNNISIDGTNKDGRELAEEISYYLNADLNRIAGAWA